MMEEGDILDGKYRLGPKIGEGSLSRVFEAQHTTLARTAAVKVFRGDLIVHAGGAQRFLADARAAWKVRHRNIVDVYEFGQLGEHVVYVAMERVKGRSLQAYFEEHGRLSWFQARGVALQVVAALKTAHRRKILHRGLKATNCFVLDEGEDDELRIKVGDFAIVRTGSATLDPGADQTSVFLGDPAYAAPEFNSKAEPSSHSDVYAVGVLLYRMLTGELPFTGETPFQVLVGHANTPVPPPRDTVPSIPEEVEAVILRALAKQPSDRFGSARELELALEKIPPESGDRAEQDALEEEETGPNQKASSPSRDEAMHAAFERQSTDDVEPEPMSSLAPQRLFPYYGPAAQGLQTRTPPPSPQQGGLRVLSPLPRGNVSAVAGLERVPAGIPESTMLLPDGGVPPSTPHRLPPVTRRTQVSGPTAHQRVAVAAVHPTVRSEETVALPGGGIPGTSRGSTVSQWTDSEATAVFTSSRRVAPVESTERLKPQIDASTKSSGHGVGIVSSKARPSAPDGTELLPAGGVPAVASPRAVTEPVPRGDVAPMASIVVPRPRVSPATPQVLLRAASTPSGPVAPKVTMFHIAVLATGALVVLGLACPAWGQAVSDQPTAYKDGSSVPQCRTELGVSIFHD